MSDTIQNLIQATSLLEPQQLLDVLLQQFTNKIALASSFSAEDQVVLHMMVRSNPDCNVFTLDTGRLPQETYDVIEKTRKYLNKIFINDITNIIMNMLQQ